MSKQSNGDIFSRFTSKTSSVLGRPLVFISALAILVLWAISGPVLGFSDTWQLIINTGTTIITFLMVFIIQNTQNRDNMAMNIKLDVILKELGVSKQELLDAEEEPDTTLEKEKKKIQNSHQKQRSHKKTKR